MRPRPLLLAAAVLTGLVAAPPPLAAAAEEPEAPGRMVLLLDSSGSMAESAGGGRSRIEAARSALRTVVDGLPAESEVGLRVFGATVFSRGDRGACTDSQLVVEPATDNRADLAAALDDYRPYGETPIPHALEEAAADLGSEGPRSIVLVSDGESTCSPDPCEVAADLAADGIELTIDVVGLSVSGAARDQLRCIAERGNGHYYDADSAADIESRLVRVAQRAARPFTLGGEPLEGGPEDAPTPVTVGDWTDTIGAGATRSFLFTRTEPGTTVRASAITPGDGSTSDGLLVAVHAPDGSRCDSSVLTRTLDVRDLIGVEAAATADPDLPDGGPCAAPGDLRITVERGRASERAAAYGLRVTEEPALAGAVPEPTSTASPEATPPRLTGPETEVLGGTSFAGATEVGPGRWSSTIVPGETLVYRVPLEHGQALTAAAVFPKAPGPVSDILEDGFPALAQLTLLNPMQAALEPVDRGETSGRPDGNSLVDATGTVERGTLRTSGAVGNAGGSRDLSMAGDYYVMVSMMDREETVELPFTLDLEVTGTAEPGPSYDGGLTWSVADGTSDPSADPTPVADEEPATSSSEQSDDGVPAGWLGAGALLVVVVGVLAALVSRGRSRRGPATGSGGRAG